MIRSANRTLSFFSKWLAEVLRQPWLMVSLILGPFVILLAFGQGVRVGLPEPRTIVVVPQTSDKLQPLPKDLNDHLDVVGETGSLADARQRLVDGQADLVLVLPPDPLKAVEQGKHATVTILTNDIDPIRKSYTRTFIREQIAEINQQALLKAITQAQGPAVQVHTAVQQARQLVQTIRSSGGNTDAARRAAEQLRATLATITSAVRGSEVAREGASFVIPGLAERGTPSDPAVPAAGSTGGGPQTSELEQDAGRLQAALAQGQAPSPADLTAIEADLNQIDQIASQAAAIPPEVLSAPFDLNLQNVAPFVPTYVGFYAPAVLALLLQHLAITLGALSMARVRLLGLMELFQVAPIRPAEAVVGNYLSYGLLCVIAAGLLLALLVVGLGVPVFGSWTVVAAVLLLLIAASLGLGFVISMVSSSEQQAAQIAMLVLIASVFFSGFVVSLDALAWPFRAIAYILPATYAIHTLQDVMLRGVLRSPVDMAVLAGVSVVLFAATVSLFRREYRPR
jgi:ABC-2 type transport system permease protein